MLEHNREIKLPSNGPELQPGNLNFDLVRIQGFRAQSHSLLLSFDQFIEHER